MSGGFPAEKELLIFPRLPKRLSILASHHVNPVTGIEKV